MTSAAGTPEQRARRQCCSSAAVQNARRTRHDHAVQAADLVAWRLNRSLASAHKHKADKMQARTVHRRDRVAATVSARGARGRAGGRRRVADGAAAAHDVRRAGHHDVAQAAGDLQRKRALVSTCRRRMRVVCRHSGAIPPQRGAAARRETHMAVHVGDGHRVAAIAAAAAARHAHDGIVGAEHRGRARHGQPVQAAQHMACAAKIRSARTSVEAHAAQGARPKRGTHH